MNLSQVPQTSLGDAFDEVFVNGPHLTPKMAQGMI